MDIMELKYRILSKHCFKEYNNMAVNKTQNNDKLVWKIKPASFHMELKSFTEASCTNNIKHWRKSFLNLLLLKVCELFHYRSRKITCSIVWFVWVFFAFLEKGTLNKYCFWEIFYLKIFSLMSQSVYLC